MNCQLSGALICIGGAQKRAGGVASAKYSRSYKRLFRRGEKAVILEFTLISCGYNLYKYHNKRKRVQLIA